MVAEVVTVALSDLCKHINVWDGIHACPNHISLWCANWSPAPSVLEAYLAI